MGAWQNNAILEHQESRNSGGVQDRNKCFGRYDVLHLLYDAPIYTSMNKAVCNTNVLQLGEDVEAHVSCIIF